VGGRRGTAYDTNADLTGIAAADISESPPPFSPVSIVVVALPAHTAGPELNAPKNKFLFVTLVFDLLSVMTLGQEEKTAASAAGADAAAGLRARTDDDDDRPTTTTHPPATASARSEL